METLLETTDFGSQSFVDFLKTLKDCKLNNFNVYNQFLGCELSIDSGCEHYDTRGSHIRICDLLSKSHFYSYSISATTIGVKLDGHKLVISGTCWGKENDFFSVKKLKSYTLEIRLVEEMWTSDGHYYLGGKVLTDIL